MWNLHAAVSDCTSDNLMVLSCMKNSVPRFNNCSPIGSLIPLNLLSWCVLSFPSPLPLRSVPVSLWLCFPPFLPPLQPEELTLLLIKLRRQQAELNSIREHTVAQLMQLNMDGDNPKVRPPEIPLQACVLACGVYAMFSRFHYSQSREFFWSSHMTDLRRKCATLGIFPIKDFALA